MFRSAHSIRRTPSPARARSLTSCLRVVAISPLLLCDSSCGQEPFMLALLPVERVDAAAVEPGVERGPQRRARGEGASANATSPMSTRKRRRSCRSARSWLSSRRPYAAVAGTRALRDDEPGGLEVPQHPRRPARPLRCLSDAHRQNLTTTVSRFDAAVLVLEADDVLELRRRHLEDRRVLERLDAVDRPGPDPERGSRARRPPSSASCPRASPISSSARPEWMSQDSSFSRWNWRLSDSPALTNRIFPQ